MTKIVLHTNCFLIMFVLVVFLSWLLPYVLSKIPYVKTFSGVWLKHTWTIQASYGFLILFNSNNIIEDIPKNITIISMILDEVINKGILLSREFEAPKTKPQVMENSERLILFPTSLLVDNIVDASDKSFWSTSVNTKRLFGDENKPWPIPWRTHAIKRT